MISTDLIHNVLYTKNYTIANVLEVANHCAEIKATSTSGKIKEFLQENRMNKGKFSKLKAVGETKIFYNEDLQNILPPHYTILYELYRLDREGKLNSLLSSGKIHKNIKREEIEDYRKVV